MTRRRVPHIPQRRPVYIGCEGASEAGYSALLQDLLRGKDLPVHIHIDELAPGAGDPFARVELAIRRLDRLRQKRIEPKDRFILLDQDQADVEPLRADRARRVAAEHGIVLIWQRPCFEAVLLRHLPDRATHKPPDTQTANRALQREWPDYQKPMSRTALAKRIDLAAIVRAAAVEQELASLLRCLGLV